MDRVKKISTVRLNDDGTRPTALRLVARVEGREVGRLVLTQGRATIGRAPENDLVVDHPTVSSQHLEADFVEGQLLVRDLGTTNGTRYQGSRIREVLLPPGATLKLGSAELRVEVEGGQEPLRLGGLATIAPAMRATLKQLRKVAASDATVLLTGETGTGKELAARAVHQTSARAGGPFEVVDCGSLVAELAAAELFGHARGAFTGADRERAGAFERAHQGTLFLDEVGELPLELQPLLLRVLERREVRRLGEESYRPVDTRVVAATNRDLEAEGLAGRFRADLWHRLSVVRIRLLPLRERMEDIPSLVVDVLEQMGPRASGFTPSPELLQALAEQPWAGNVRELRNMIERAVALSADGALDAGDVVASDESANPADYRAARARALDAFERHFVLQLLKSTGNNVAQAARDAGIARVYLHRLIKKHGLGS